MRYIHTLWLLLGASFVGAQPIQIPEISTPEGHYIFTVYTPVNTQESPIWRFDGTELSTHRLIDQTDSTVMRLVPVQHTSLRTYLASGATAGAVEVMEEPGSPSIEELLVYPMLLSPVQRQLTESYLAIRHGLTLSQLPPTNYLAQAADASSYTVWAATAEPLFRQRIIGLAVDSSANLHKLSGSSVLASKLLKLAWSAAPAGTAYLLLADNDAPTAPDEQQVNADHAPLQRRWRVQTTGNQPPTTLTFDTRQFFSRAKPGESWRLHLEYPDGTSIAYPAEADATGVLVFPSVQFPADAVTHFTLSLPFSPLPDQSSLSANLSPNPIMPGQRGQLRVQLPEESALQLAVYDLSGRLLQERRLPAATHHLTEVSFPAPGIYTLHLRPRPRFGSSNKKALSQTIKVVVQ